MADKGKAIYDGLIARGFTAPQAAALAGNIQQESSFNPAATNAGSDAHGLMQWRLDRKTGLDTYAKDTGRDAGDLDTQLDYIVKEMTGNEASNAAAFLASNDVATANAALKKYIRYGKNEGGKRLDYAMAFANDPGVVAPTEADASGTGFVNPAGFSGDIETPAYAVAPTAPPQPDATDQRLVPDAGPTDDDILKMFLPPEPGAPAAPASEASPDDDLLKAFLPDNYDQPEAAKKYVTQPDLTAVPFVGPIAGALGYNGQPQEVAPGYEPSSIPVLDPVNAFATKALESIPVAGPALNSLAENLDAGTYNLLNKLTGSGAPQVTAEDRAKINAGDQAQNPLATTTGEIAGQVGPLMGLGATALGGRLLGSAGPMAARIAAGGTTGATIGGLDTLARGGSPEDAGWNALTGGVVGGMAPVAVKVIDKVGNKLLSAAPNIAELAEKAMSKYGIPVEAAQMSKNPLVKHAGDIVNKIPGLGGTAAKGKQVGAFNSALAKEMGETADALTPDVMQAAKDRIGDAFDNVARRVPVIKSDTQFENDLLKAVTDAESTVDDAKMKPIIKQFENIANTFKTGSITGDQYLSLTSKDSILSKAIAQGGDIGNVASEMKDALFGALQRSAPKDVLQDLTKARYQWKVMRTLENPAARSPTGEISPAQLMSVVLKNFGGKAYGQAGNMGELADIGMQLLKDPNSSQTAERGAVMLGLEKLLHSPAAAAAAVGGAALTPGVIPAVAANLPLVGLGAILSRAAAGGLRSKALTNKLIQNALRPANANAATKLSIAAQSAVPLATPRKPISITVRGGNPLLSGG